MAVQGTDTYRGERSYGTHALDATPSASDPRRRTVSRRTRGCSDRWHLAGISACIWAVSETAGAGTVTLYGLADVAIRFESNQDARNRSVVRMTEGAISPSRFGMRGSETLSTDLRAYFEIEAGFDLETGAMVAGGRRLFHRWAFVGLESKRFGQIAFGRQGSVMFDSLTTTFDPMTLANYNGNSWLTGALSGGIFLDNTIKYRFTHDGLTLLAAYSMGYDTFGTDANGFSGNVPGRIGAGSMRGLGAIYQTGRWGFAGIWQQGRDHSNRRRDSFNAAMTYQLGHTQIAGGYMHSRDNTGGLDARLNRGLPGRSPAAYKGTNRLDDGFYLGATWQPNAHWRLMGAWYFDRMRNATHAFTAAGSPIKGIGYRHSWALHVQYAFSKTVYTYAEADYGVVTAAARANFPGSRHQYGAAVGIGKRF
ncbi:porin [Robbsia andropogonis]|uniref:porin n=1 Tax=Robbsia andropogonis TaxID=28092 RepID=UPI000465BC2C|nr:porin [Robbsia andropogonis]